MLLRQKKTVVPELPVVPKKNLLLYIKSGCCTKTLHRPRSGCCAELPVVPKENVAPEVPVVPKENVVPEWLLRQKNVGP